MEIKSIESLITSECKKHFLSTFSHLKSSFNELSSILNEMLVVSSKCMLETNEAMFLKCAWLNYEL